MAPRMARTHRGVHHLLVSEVMLVCIVRRRRGRPTGVAKLGAIVREPVLARELTGGWHG
jgi:hypothetical protein